MTSTACLWWYHFLCKQCNQLSCPLLWICWIPSNHSAFIFHARGRVFLTSPGYLPNIYITLFYCEILSLNVHLHQPQQLQAWFDGHLLAENCVERSSRKQLEWEENMFPYHTSIVKIISPVLFLFPPPPHPWGPTEWQRWKEISFLIKMPFCSTMNTCCFAIVGLLKRVSKLIFPFLFGNNTTVRAFLCLDLTEVLKLLLGCTTSDCSWGHTQLNALPWSKEIKSFHREMTAGTWVRLWECWGWIFRAPHTLLGIST